MRLEDLWAKTDEHGQPSEGLLNHMKAVGETAEKLLSDSLYVEIRNDLAGYLGVPREDVIPLLKYLAAMHDIGKAHPLFQKLAIVLPEEYDDDRQITTYRHEIGSERILRRIWKQNLLFGKRTARYFAFVTRLHHQRKTQGEWFSVSDRWEQLQDAIEEDIRIWSGVKPMEINGDADAACTIIAAVTIICDWIASSGNIEGAFEGLRLAKAQPLKAENFEKLFGFPARTIQKELTEHLEQLEKMPLMAVIEAPMGEGKTEAGIFMAYKMAEYWGKNGLYFALPTTATSNQMVNRVRDIVKDETQLIHASSWLLEENEAVTDEESRQEFNKWKAPRKRALFARFGVGTVDQVMATVLRVRYGILRILGLTNKVIIVDELHSYDTYMSTILARLVEWCRDLHIPVVMLSATLPQARKEEMLAIGDLRCKEYPLITEVFEDGNLIEVPIKSVFKHSSISIEFTNTIPKMPEEGCIAIIVNTVKKAVEIYQMLDVPADEKMLFHSRFTVARRMEIEKTVIKLFGKGAKRPKRMVLVATQVAEQSLDVDFDLLFTELAPIDLVLQRIGRLHRHDIPRPLGLELPKCVVFAEGLGTGKYVYYELLLERSKALLKAISTIKIPEDIPALVEKVYLDEPDEDLIVQFLEKQTDMQIQKGAARSVVLAAPDKTTFGLYSNSELNDETDSFIKAGTRLGADSIRICLIPPELYDQIKDKKRLSSEKAKEVFSYSITVSNKYVKAVESNDYFEGEGKLFGCYVVRATAGNAPEKTITGVGIKADRILGFMETKQEKEMAYV